MVIGEPMMMASRCAALKKAIKGQITSPKAPSQPTKAPDSTTDFTCDFKEEESLLITRRYQCPTFSHQVQNHHLYALLIHQLQTNATHREYGYVLGCCNHATLRARSSTPPARRCMYQRREVRQAGKQTTTRKTESDIQQRFTTSSMDASF